MSHSHRAGKGPANRGPVFEHIPDGTAWRQVKRNPVVLTMVGTETNPLTKRPSKITFERDFRPITGPRVVT